MRQWVSGEEPKTAKVEVEEIRRGIDAAQGTIEFEVISLVLLNKTTAEHNLEHIASQTVLDAFSDILPVLIVSQRAPDITHGMEVVCLHISLIHRLLNGSDI